MVASSFLCRMSPDDLDEADLLRSWCLSDKDNGEGDLARCSGGVKGCPDRVTLRPLGGVNCRP